jgi:hypothetical protein
MTKKHLGFDDWLEAMRNGAVGKQSGNSNQAWIYSESTASFTQSYNGEEIKTYSIAQMRASFSGGRDLWIEVEASGKVYKYRLDPKYDLNYYQRRYRRISSDRIEYIYNNPGALELESNILVNKPHKPHQVEMSINYKKSRIDVVIYTADLVLTETPLDNGMSWSSTRKRILRFGSDHLLEQIRTRYAFFDRPTNGLSNIIIDNYVPKLMYTTQLNARDIGRLNLPKTIYTISPWFAQHFGAQQVPTEQLCRIIGYDVKTLKQMITKIKHRQCSITFIGYGGTNVNTIHWLTEIMKLTQSVNLFKFMEIFEPDTAEVSNLLRFPKNPYVENTKIDGTHISSSSKLKLLDPSEVSLLSKEKPVLSTSRVNGQNLPRGSKGSFYDYSERKTKPKDNHYYYGAPNIDTRASFEDVGHFISATHSGNDAHLWLNPTQDTDLQVESYGLIQLTPFFMNQLRLAIGLMEVLCDGDLNLKGKDQMLLEYSFDGIPKLSTNKTYNFQLGSHNGNVATEMEAATAW